MTRCGPIAQINVGRAIYDLDDPRMAEFMENLDRVNGLAERSPGFLWRFQDESGNATETKIDGDPRELLNISVWQSVADLERFAFATLHARFFQRQHEWFERPEGVHFAMWPVARDARPGPQEALAKLDDLRHNGPGEHVFGWDDVETAGLRARKRMT